MQQYESLHKWHDFWFLMHYVQVNAHLWLLRQLVTACKQVFFTDKKIFYINPPVSTQNDRVWSAGRKRDVFSSRLLIESAKFALRVMVSAGVCLQDKGRLHFVQKKSKFNADY